MNSALSIANYFVTKGIEEKKPVTLMKLMKLVYFAHAWNLAINDDELISENFQAWKFGPVLDSLYHTAKWYGRNEIEKPIRDQFGSEVPLPELTPDEESLMESIWKHYGKFDALQLSVLTHEKDSPWYKVYEEGGGKDRRFEPISNELIKECFRSKIASFNGRSDQT